MNSKMLIALVAIGAAVYLLLKSKQPVVRAQTQPAVPPTVSTGTAQAPIFQAGRARAVTDNALKYAQAGKDLLGTLTGLFGGNSKGKGLSLGSGGNGGSAGGQRDNNQKSDTKNADQPQSTFLSSDLSAQDLALTGIPGVIDQNSQPDSGAPAGYDVATDSYVSDLSNGVTSGPVDPAGESSL